MFSTRIREVFACTGALACAAAGLFVLVLLVPSLSGCGQGENTVVNPDGNRAEQVLPDTTGGFVPSADRTFRPTLFTGNSAVFAVASDGDVRSTAYLRFITDELPDTVGVTGAELTIHLTDYRGGPFRLELLELESSAGEWEEIDLADTEFDVIELALDTSTLFDPADGDTSAVLDVPGSLVRRWKNFPETNTGVAIRFAPNSEDGSLRFHSSESSTTGKRPTLEIERTEDVSVFESADHDGYVLIDESPADAGDATELRLQEESPWRALFRFEVDDFELQPGDAINRAFLTVYPVAGSVAETDSFEVGVYEATGEWMEAVEPDSVGRSTLSLDLVEVNADTDSLVFDMAPLVQRWLDGDENFGFHMRILTEGRGDAGVLIHSREADASVQPHLTIVYTEPPGPRWEGPTSARLGGDAP